MTASATTPSRISSSSLAFIMLSQAAIASKRRLESIMVPSESFVFMMMRSISSPILSSDFGSAVGSLLYSSMGTKPAYFLPISTCISLGAIPTTTPRTFWSELIDLRFSSKAASKLISSGLVCSFKISDMVDSTSFIIPAGVEAPAVTPTERKREKSYFASSRAVSTRKVGQFFSHTALSLAVLELERPPTTIIASERSDSSNASFCLSLVALHIVSKKKPFVHSFFKFFEVFSHSFTEKVVCATTYTSPFSISG